MEKEEKMNPKYSEREVQTTPKRDHFIVNFDSHVDKSSPVCYSSTFKTMGVSSSSLTILRHLNLDQKTEQLKGGFKDLGINRAFSGALLAFSRDDEYLAAGSVNENKCYLWNLSELKYDQQFTIRENNPIGSCRVSAMVFSKTGKIFFYGTSGEQAAIYIFRKQNKEFVQCHKIKYGEISGMIPLLAQPNKKFIQSNKIEDDSGQNTVSKINSIIFSSTGNYMAVGGSLGIEVWDFEKNHKLNISSIPVQTLAFSPNGEYLASADEPSSVSNSCSIYLWNVSTRTLLCKLNEHQMPVDSIAFSNDGKKFASGDRNGVIYLWAITWNSPSEQRFQKNNKTLDIKSGVSQLIFTPGNNYLVVSESNKPWAHFYHVDSFFNQYVESTSKPSCGNEIAKSVKEPGLKSRFRVPFNEYDQVVGQLNGACYLSRKIAFFINHAVIVKQLDQTTDQEQLSASPFWKKEFAKDSDVRGMHLAFSPDTQYLAAGSVNENKCYLWNLGQPDDEQVLEIEKGNRFAAGVSAVAFSPDGTRFFCGTQRGKAALYIFEKRNEKFVLIKTIKHGEGPERSLTINSIIFTSDGKYMAVGGKGGIDLWDLLAESKCNISSIAAQTLAFSPNGEYLVSADELSSPWAACPLRLWNVSTRAVLCVFNGHQIAVDSIVFTPDGKKFLSGDKDGVIRLWAVTSDGKEGKIFRIEYGTMHQLVFTPDHYLVIVGRNPRVYFYDVDALFYHVDTLFNVEKSNRATVASSSSVLSNFILSDDGAKRQRIGGTSVSSTTTTTTTTRATVPALPAAQNSSINRVSVQVPPRANLPPARLGDHNVSSERVSSATQLGYSLTKVWKPPNNKPQPIIINERSTSEKMDILISPRDSLVSPQSAGTPQLPSPSCLSEEKFLIEKDEELEEAVEAFLKDFNELNKTLEFGDQPQNNIFYPGQ